MGGYLLAKFGGDQWTRGDMGWKRKCFLSHLKVGVAYLCLTVTSGRSMRYCVAVRRSTLMLFLLLVEKETHFLTVCADLNWVTRWRHSWHSLMSHMWWGGVGVCLLVWHHITVQWPWLILLQNQFSVTFRHLRQPRVHKPQRDVTVAQLLAEPGVRHQIRKLRLPVRHTCNAATFIAAQTTDLMADQFVPSWSINRRTHITTRQCSQTDSYYYRATARNAMHNIALVILSVYLSHVWIVTKLNDALQIFWYHTKVFWHQQWLLGAAPFRQKFALKVTHPLRKMPTSTDLCL